MLHLEFSILCSRLAEVGRSRKIPSGLLRNLGDFRKKVLIIHQNCQSGSLNGKRRLEPEQIGWGFMDRPVKHVP